MYSKKLLISINKLLLLSIHIMCICVNPIYRNIKKVCLRKTILLLETKEEKVFYEISYFWDIKYVFKYFIFVIYLFIYS